MLADVIAWYALLKCEFLALWERKEVANHIVPLLGTAVDEANSIDSNSRCGSNCFESQFVAAYRPSMAANGDMCVGSWEFNFHWVLLRRM